MAIHSDELCREAREQALQHSFSISRKQPRYIKQHFEESMNSLRDFIQSLQQNKSSCAQPAEEWLLDNIEFIEEQALDVDRQLTERMLTLMPLLKNTGRLRIEAVCELYLELVDGVWSEETFVSFINAYQEIAVLQHIEISVIASVLRIALMNRIARMMRGVRERHDACIASQRLLETMGPGGVTQGRIHKALEAWGQSYPLSGPWIVHLISHLREWAGDSEAVREWLLCSYENGAEDLNRIITYEHQLQAGFQVTAGNLISSLRQNERRDWQGLFERISVLDRSLRHAQASDYAQLDQASKHEVLTRIALLSRRMRVPESLIASEAIKLSQAAQEKYNGASSAEPVGEAREITPTHVNPTEQLMGSGEIEALPRRLFVPYYLFDPAGENDLIHALRKCSDPKRMPANGARRRSASSYLTALAGLSAVFFVLGILWIGTGERFSWAGYIAVGAALVLPACEWGKTWLHYGIESLIKPRILLRYDFSGDIPREAATMVVIPAIWSSEEEIEELADRLEVHYLANRDPNIHYALLGDFTDSEEERLPEDGRLAALGMSRMKELTDRYGANGSTFHFMQRARKWNPCEKVYMGWERKRGKLVEFVELLKGSATTSYAYRSGDETVLPKIRYVITLDCDTQLPLGAAKRMIGTIHLPYNRPRLNKERTRVVEGYGVLQPRIGISHDSAMRSRLAELWSEPGIDPYVFAASDPYQDALSQGIFTGKGIFDVDVFAELLCERIPDNAVLSHDLLEGGFLRAAQLSDIELVDDTPSTFIAFQKRMHRWVRGDWQLLCWLYSRVCDRRGVLRRIDLSIVTRWQMIDNLRRSVMPIAYLVLFALSFTVLPGPIWRWSALLLATMFLPLIKQAAASISNRDASGMLSTTAHLLLNLITLPFECAVLLNAIGKSLYRQFVSKRRLLEWTSSSHIERETSGGSRRPVMLHMGGSYALILLFAATAILRLDASAAAWGLSFSAVWALSPAAVRWLDKPRRSEEWLLEPQEEAELHNLARQIWSFYEDFAGAEDHYLPPDNVQLEPSNGVAHRTSPTNIGFLLTAALAAREFGFIQTPELIKRLDHTIATVEKMEKWHGHLYNWYDTTTLSTLPPAYVSTVDSGNFVASLMTVKEGLAHWLKLDVRSRTEQKELEVCGRGLLARIEKLIAGTNFRSLYDDQAKLFVLGYNAAAGQRDTILYDLLASEARQTSFVAIALGQISVSHWMALGRTVKLQGNRKTLVSWSGTMFEYMMPWLIMRTYRNTIWDNTYRGVIARQIEYAQERSVPFGISESGYYAFDFQLNYQYRAFGVPGLGFKRGLDEDLVVAPYATIMALPYAMKEGLKELKRLEEMGGRGEYGFYEAVDFTPERMPNGESRKVIRSFMAHHQGMSLLTLANILLPNKLYDYFHRDKRVKSAELLLIEKTPSKHMLLERELATRTGKEPPKPAHAGPLREFNGSITTQPEVNVHSNGKLTTVVSNTGSGLIRYEGMAVTRWREDAVLDPWGSFIYIRDAVSEQTWSPSFLPTRVASDSERISFLQASTVFERSDNGIETKLEITVPPEQNADVRLLTLSNKSNEVRIIEVTTFLEAAMASPDADRAHPAFTKLFVQTEYIAEHACLLARKRPRKDGEPSVWAYHTLAAFGEHRKGGLEYETDRASFIGRGHTLAAPRGISGKLEGTVGSVADPAFIMRRRISIEPGEKATLVAITGIADSKETALEEAGKLSGENQAEAALRHAWTRSQIELQHLRITPQEAAVYQMLAGRVLYSAPLKEEQKRGILLNSKGQQGLWAYGISGDRPLILARIDDVSNLAFIGGLVKGFAYLQHQGLSFDLAIWNETAGGYTQELRDTLLRMIEQTAGWLDASKGNIHVIAGESLPEEDEHLLLTVSRYVLSADGPSLRAQLQLAGTAVARHAPRHIRKLKASDDKEIEAREMARASEWTTGIKEQLFFNGYGGFAKGGKEYQIVLQEGMDLPAPWLNVMANPQFGCTVSELYTGYSWWRNSRECKLTPWSNDPALDPPGEVCYLRDELTGEYWQTAPSRGADRIGVYKISHGQGYTRYEHDSHGLRQEMTVFVPLEEPLKIIRLKLNNLGDDRRELSLTYYAEWVLGVNREGAASYVVTDYDEYRHTLIARNTYQETFRDATAFLTMHAEGGGQSGISFTCDRTEFLGRAGTCEQPAAMGLAHLSCESGVTHDACGAMQLPFSIEAGGERVLYILLGCDQSREAVYEIARKYEKPDNCEQALEEVMRYWEELLGTIRVSTPAPAMDVMMNQWLLYQSLACRIWARSAFYQAGGAFGYRDQLQDSLSMLHSMPELTRKQIILHASHQYEEGDVQHWWHEETERGIRTKFSDDLLWLPYAVIRYIDHTGDDSVLRETAPYLRSSPLTAEEHERYEETVLSGQSGTILDHCIRALDRSLRFGEHGLPLMGIGDWNDGMSMIGPEGRGESVWLGWFQGIALEGMAELCERQGDKVRASRYRIVHKELAAALNENGWDGKWFRRAFTDSGQWLGTIHNSECRIDAIAQSWSVISGMAEEDKAQQAMRSFDRELVNHSLSIAHILTPPFDKTEPSPGYIQGYPPGIRENGGQYTHGVIWSIVAWSMLGEGRKAFELFDMFNPVNHTKTTAGVKTYCGEPYAVAADVYSEEPLKGHAGWTWYTGAAGWLYQAGLEWILGIRRKGERLSIRPSIPEDWPEFRVSYRYGTAVYHIHVKNPPEARARGEESELIINGREADADAFASDGHGVLIPLIDDGEEHQIELTLLKSKHEFAEASV
ncbi:glucoamylase family protein [Paenibacillus sp. HB172176]|uniref:GH36-type glycosyl hydrolase domain-containing protein n=1 Tax=Paenibacillus sp. HB172176 TaxID=2493690 RepID=UPI00143C4462|nr:glucoamylase family protein [Paenibacillus sp. HB172176]